MKVYLAHPISGSTAEEVINYYETTRDYLLEHGWEVLQPMTGKGHFRVEKSAKFVPGGYTSPFSTNHAIIERDNWMVHQADVVLVDLTGATGVSIGCMMELAWAMDNRKHTIVVFDKTDFHKHAFVLECADVVLETKEEALEYLVKMAEQRI